MYATGPKNVLKSLEPNVSWGLYHSMDPRKTSLQRAFELARSGSCLNVYEIIMRLNAERYDASQVEGPALKKQLFQIIENGRHPKEQNSDQFVGSLDTGI